MSKKITGEEIILRFKQTHGDKYEYRNVLFSKMKEKVEIICPNHGLFWQTPDHHIRGTDCPDCSRLQQGKLKKNNAAKDFISKAITVHGEVYDYTNFVYEGNKTKIEITCPIHGSFKQTPSNHLSGFGCPKCGRERTEISRKLSVEDFFNRCKEEHKNFYLYPKKNYINPESIITVVCPKHGNFSIKARNHLWIKQGCRDCYEENQGINKRIPWPQFIQAAIKYHGNTYQYDQSSFQILSEFVRIYCIKHGWFEQRGHRHLSGQGCPTCARQLHRGKWKSELLPQELRDINCNLYYFRLIGNSEDFYKIGITNDVNRRRITIERQSGYTVEVVSILAGTLYSSMQLEESLHEEYIECSYLPKIKFPGYTECFSIDVFGK
ncbi:hypothetical protein ACM55F_04210 [Flavobacterium sp. XS2P12]|uniref:hypothetical protein n=1 Tax=Flavobacterium melibiosi TaxID=3398734 RepID=UPI003A88CCDE